ncbi:MAG: cytochrome b/b6 domain-containing protein [Gammaproteobacteria bacterium]|nr:MAG: cytochrome b/b6 domain-containing protein [Gammaproteobacteria bacterium]
MSDVQDSSAAQVLRHRLAERLFHWLMAVCMLVLLLTGFLPVLGVNFAWVDPHWIAGVILTVLVLFHVVRALFFLSLSNIWIRWREFTGSVSAVTAEALGKSNRNRKIGKYSVGQKGFHHAVALVVLLAIVTGLVMMVGIDGPFWERNPFIISESSRGLVFVLHGFAGLISITMVMVHVYFAMRPEKMYMTRSMIRGWISREEFEQNHDPELWQE